MAGKRMADSGDLGYTPPADRCRVTRVRGYKERPLGPSDEDRLRWQRFLAELPDRIARIRYDEAPLLCPTCGSTTPKPVETRWCARCERTLPLAAFPLDAARPAGRRYRCAECHAETTRRWRARRAVAAVRDSERAS